MKYLALTLTVLSLASLSAQTYSPLTAGERLQWFGNATYNTRSLLISGPVAAAWRTYTNRPEEWGPHWDGFGKRYGARLLNNTVTNGLETGFGAIWKEDPRYFPLGQGSKGKRIGQAFKQTWMSRYGDGNYRFGAAKAIGITGSVFGQKLWMPASVTSNQDCALRIGGNYAGRFFGNLFKEFRPEIKKLIKFGRN